MGFEPKGARWQTVSWEAWERAGVEKLQLCVVRRTTLSQTRALLDVPGSGASMRLMRSSNYFFRYLAYKMEMFEMESE